MPPRRIAVGLTTACFAALIAGCASSSSPSSTSPHTASTTRPPLSAAAYRTALRHIAQEENSAQHKVHRAFSAHTVGQVRAALAAFDADQRRAAQRVSAIIPPADAAAANVQLARAFSDNAAAINTVLTRLRAAKTVKQALTTIQNDRQARQVGQEIDSALRRLNKLGYASRS